jgi:hypothetical protein
MTWFPRAKFTAIGGKQLKTIVSIFSRGGRIFAVSSTRFQAKKWGGSLRAWWARRSAKRGAPTVFEMRDGAIVFSVLHVVGDTCGVEKMDRLAFT